GDHRRVAAQVPPPRRRRRGRGRGRPPRIVTAMAYAEPTWGEMDPAVFERIVVVSPHFDDAAMGAGHLLGSYADTTVITVLAGRPPAYPAEPSEWDALGGFVAGDDVVAVRRGEGGGGVAGRGCG